MGLWSSKPAAPARIVGLTGGIASGKSTVSGFLGEHGAAVLDADKLGHKCYEPGSACLREVVGVFGDGILSEDGTVNRPALGAIVFSDKTQLEKLNATVWPYIRRMVEEEIARHRAGPGGVLVVEAAVLVEAAWIDLFDEVWVVHVSPENARARLMKRSGFSEEEADKRISAQLPTAERLAKATSSICNDGSLEALRRAVEASWGGLQLRLTGGSAPGPPPPPQQQQQQQQQQRPKSRV